MELSKKDLFFCYDFGLKNKLKEHGISFIVTAISNNERRFWLYFRTNEVNMIMKEYLNQNLDKTV